VSLAVSQFPHSLLSSRRMFIKLERGKEKEGKKNCNNILQTNRKNEKYVNDL